MFNYVELQLCFGNSALQILLSGCFTVDENTGERSKTIKDTKIRGKASSVITMGVNVIVVAKPSSPAGHHPGVTLDVKTEYSCEI